MRSSNVLQSLDIQPINIATKHFCWKQVIQVEQTVALRDNTRVTEWGSRHKKEGKDASTFISSSIRVFGILSLQIAVYTLVFQFWNWWPKHVTPLIKTHGVTGSLDYIQKTFCTPKGLFWPSFDSMSNIVVSDSLAELGAAVTLLRDGWDGLGTAIGFVVSFSFNLLPRFPTWHLQGQPQKWNHNDHKRMNPLCHFSSRASLSS